LRSHPTALACLLYGVLTIALTGRALVGRGAMGPDSALDHDRLYQQDPAPNTKLLTNGDHTPPFLDLPRDLRFAHELHRGRFDVWNPLAGCGAPLWAEQGGPMFPLKLPFYLVPSDVAYKVAVRASAARSCPSPKRSPATSGCRGRAATRSSTGTSGESATRK
jgi:hypothetical protein